MNHPFSTQHGGFGFGPADGPSQSLGFGPGFQPGRGHGHGHGHDRGRGHGPGHGFDFGFDPRGGGFGFGPRGRRGPGPRGRRGKRGDVRAAILSLLVERPMHGYEMIQQIAERTDNIWAPSPGSVYPTLQLLEDEGLIAAADSEGSKKLFELTAEGRAAAEKIETPPWESMAEDVEPAQANLRNAVTQFVGAVGQSAYAASEDQQERIVEIVNNARREIYQILAED